MTTSFKGPIRAGTKRDTGADRNSGAVVLAQYKDWLRTDAAESTLCILPAGSRIVDIHIDVEASVNSTVATMNVGYTGASAALISGANVKTEGRNTAILATAGVAVLNTLVSVDTTLIYTVNQAQVSADQGSGTVIVVYTQEKF